MFGKLQGPVRRPGILTGGGDAPGLNAATKAVAYRAEPANIEVAGIGAGWEGLTLLNRARSIAKGYRPNFDRMQTDYRPFLPTNAG